MSFRIALRSLTSPFVKTSKTTSLVANQTSKMFYVGVLTYMFLFRIIFNPIIYSGISSCGFV